MSLALAATGLGSVVVQGGVVKPFVKRFGERGALYTGLAAGALGMTWYASARTGLLYWGGVPIFAFVGLVGPGVQGLMTRCVAPTEQGRLQGANAGLMAMAGLIGPLFFTELFAWSISGGRAAPGLAIYVAAGVFIVALALAMRTPRLDAADAAPA